VGTFLQQVVSLVAVCRIVVGAYVIFSCGMQDLLVVAFEVFLVASCGIFHCGM
jgi:hypothetical protein